MRYVPRDHQFQTAGWRRDCLRLSLLVAFALAIVQPSLAYELSATAVGSAGGDAAGGGYQLGSTVGLAVVGASSTSSFEHLAGFWRWSPDPGTSGVESTPENGVPRRAHLAGAAPNPFRRSTEVQFDVAGTSPTRAQLQVFDVAGRMVARLVDDELAPGTYRYAWNGRGRYGEALASGVYFARFVADGYSATQRIVLSR